jgi:hypothetical protein
MALQPTAMTQFESWMVDQERHHSKSTWPHSVPPFIDANLTDATEILAIALYFTRCGLKELLDSKWRLAATSTRTYSPFNLSALDGQLVKRCLWPSYRWFHSPSATRRF